MLPLATVGFISAGLFFIVFAYTFFSLTEKKLPKVLRHFSYAYISLASAFIVWGIAAFIGEQRILNQSVTMGNILLLLSTFFLLNFYFADNKRKYPILGGWIILSVLFLWWRVVYFFPQPVLLDGILVFNTPLPVSAVLGLIILSIWLPANLKVAKVITEKLKKNELSFIYASVYVLATFAALLFLAAKTTLVIILSFAVLVISFIILIASNFLVQVVKK